MIYMDCITDTGPIGVPVGLIRLQPGDRFSNAASGWAGVRKRTM